MTLSGIGLGFSKGWSLALAMLAVGPMVFIGVLIFGVSLKNRSQVFLKAYAQSAGYAEQALQAIRIVVSFGMEKSEINNYSRFLERVTKAGYK